LFHIFREIIPTIEVTGAIGFYHEKFAAVSKKASHQYLDGIFVDMMWFKAFSVWLTLRVGMNVIFQDVDLVWFKEPYSYFREYGERAATAHHNGEQPDAYFSDDGQRGSIRYSPFYANSGFYYLRNNPKTLYFAYSVMTSFDTMQASGSHQNVFTLRLAEGLDIADLNPKLLSVHDFPTGVVYHHEKEYMEKIINGESSAYNFHMCWTADKTQKLDFFRKAKLWYLKLYITIDDVIPPKGKYHKMARELHKRKGDWKKFINNVCSRMDGAP
jgi:hypothetical protein